MREVDFRTVCNELTKLLCVFRSAETSSAVEMPEHTDIEMRHSPVEVVISGLSGRLPESDNIAEFREHLINGDDMITDDDRRWEPGKQNCLSAMHSCSTNSII